jgi:hypothetical protein
MNNCFEGLKNQISRYLLSVYALTVLQIFCCLVMEKIKDKVLACFYENTY